MDNKQFQLMPLESDKTIAKENMLNQIDGNIQFLSKQPAKQSKDNLIQNKQKQHDFRNDIQGLRALAVLTVVLFHAYPEFMTGGFIGVDIFFVISGYLITGIIYKKSIKNQFSFSDFYSRRVKRIYPILLVVLVTVLIISCKKLLFVPLGIVSKTLAASTIFSANLEILTYKKGYFDPQVKTNPLLHLWSLGVQQQFYIIWPFFIMLTVKKFSSQVLFLLLSMFTVWSFLYDLFSVEMNAKFAFYFPFCRFWQMAIGGFIGCSNIRINNKILANVLSIGGMICILTTIWIINEQSLFPGWWALIPTLSAAAIISAGNNSLLNQYVLSSRPLVFIGQISYSMYLWHWPLLVFSRLFYPKGSQSLLGQTYVILIITLILSILSLYVVENPFRHRKSKFVVIGLLIAMISLGAYSYVISKNPEQYSALQRQLRQIQKNTPLNLKPGPLDYYVKDGKNLTNSSKNKFRQRPTVQMIKQSISRNADFPADGKYLDFMVPDSNYIKNYPQWVRVQTLNEGKQYQLLLIGDSHSWQLSSRFSQIYQERKQKNQTQNFPTLISLVRHGEVFLPCNAISASVYDMIRENGIQRVLITNRFLHYYSYTDPYGPLNTNRPTHSNVSGQCYPNIEFEDIPKQTKKDVEYDLELLSQSIKKMVDLKAEVYVMAMRPQGDRVNPKLMFEGDNIVQSHIQPIILSEWRKQNQKFIVPFETAVKKAGGKLIDHTQTLCWQDVCQVLIPSGYTTHADHHHYTAYYNRYWSSSVDFLVDF